MIAFKLSDLGTLVSSKNTSPYANVFLKVFSNPVSVGVCLGGGEGGVNGLIDVEELS